MRILISLLIAAILWPATVPAQSPPPTSGAANPGQVSTAECAADLPTEAREVKIPAGTPVEIEVAYTISSLDVRPEDLISFRVIVPIKIDGVTLIEKYSLVTARVLEAKRGRHWGRAGKLSWLMQDAVAVDLTRVSLEARNELANPKSGIKGDSHAAEVATHMIVFGALMWPIAPVMLMHGFKRGENAVLPEGKRFIVFVKNDTVIKIPAAK